MLSEVLLDVISFFDYATLVFLRLANKQLLCFADRYAEQLAFRRTFNVSCRILEPQVYQLSVSEVRANITHVPQQTIVLDASDTARTLRALDELYLLIGPHAVLEVGLGELPFSVKLFVERVPALRHASEVHLDYESGFSPSLQEYKEIVSFFERPKRVCFWEIPIEALVAFLESHAHQSSRTGCDSQENIIFRSYFDCTNLEQGESKHFMFMGWNLRWDFLRRIIE
ncbi:hypothetical protein AAVH_40153, partial [Aphelenchoides avenae]